MSSEVDFEELELLENKFKEQDFNSKKGHVLLDGDGSIMLSASHAVEQTRGGRIKLGEYRTGVIVSIMHSLTNCPVIYKTKNIGNDANYSPRSAYRSDLVKYIKSNENIKLLIDLHISHPFRPYSIDIGTGRSNHISYKSKLLSTVIDTFSINTNYDISIDGAFPVLYPHTVSATVHRECNIPTIQLECNWVVLCDWDRASKFIIKCEELVNNLRGML